MIGAVSFLYPAILATLLVLPLIWYLLRVMPPAPRRIFFPATNFLSGLIPKDTTPSKTPWWILLLRLLMAALIIIALAQPVINKSEHLSGSGTIRIVLDNSWAGAFTWEDQTALAEEIINQAGRENRPILLLTTAPQAGETKPFLKGPLIAPDALSNLRGLAPLPWPADYKAAADAIKTQNIASSVQTFWLSNGIDEGGISALIQTLQGQGGLTYVRPTAEDLPLILRPSSLSLEKNNVAINIETIQSNHLSIQAQGRNGQILDIQSVKTENSKQHTVIFDIEETLRTQLTQFRISGKKNAGSVFILDDQSKRRNVGILAAIEKSDTAPLIDDTYYIRRALEPYATLTLGGIDDLIAKNVDIIILPDIAALPSETLNVLEKWVKAGGLLLRFSGPTMAQSQSGEFLLPVTLRSGGRSLSGAMTWEKPQIIAPFSDTSPFYGLTIPPELTIRQQLLADPAQDLSGKVWAQLADGTPLITASQLDNGLLVLVHTSAGPHWSDLPLSGLYVNILRRIAALAGSTIAAQSAQSHATLDPVLVMDGYGNLQSPTAAVKPLPASALEKTIPSALHPPGLYAQGGLQYALNLGTNLPKLKIAPPAPAGVHERGYSKHMEIDLMPSLLTTAFLLFMLDWAVMILLTGNILRLRRTALMIFLIMIPLPAAAQSQSDVERAGGLYLAYIQTGDETLDELCARGLENLKLVLTQRTSVEPEGVISLNPETDTLSFYPIIYWPINESQKTLSERALQNIQHYLDHGGTILFDTRDESRSKTGATETPAGEALRNLTAGLNIPPLAPIEDKHVLGQSFYLMQNFPGRYEHGTLWIQQDAAVGRDGVSAVIVGSNDWAGAWASYGDGYPPSRYNPTLENSQNEMAMRFGVNLVMYALTGNYKADQVHIPFILERLGQ